MLLAIDRVSKFTDVEFHASAGKMEGSAFLRNAVAAFPDKIHTVLTDNGMAFVDLPRNRTGASRQFLGPHIFGRVYIEHEIEHRLTKPYHPWTNGQAERMNRTIKDAAEGLPLRRPREPEGVCSDTCDRKIRQALRGLALEAPGPACLSGLDQGPRPIQDRAASPHPGTTHVEDFDSSAWDMWGMSSFQGIVTVRPSP